MRTMSVGALERRSVENDEAFTRTEENEANNPAEFNYVFKSYSNIREERNLYCVKYR